MLLCQDRLSPKGKPLNSLWGLTLRRQKPYFQCMKRLNILSRNNLYAIVLVYFLVLFAAVLITSESYGYFEGDFYPRLLGLLVAVLWGSFFIFAAELLRTFGYSASFIRAIRFILLFCFIVGFTLANPLLDYQYLAISQSLFVLFHVLTFCLILIILRAILTDIFRSESTHQDHIWGAVVCYFLGILLFADIYEIISLVTPGLLGKVYERGLPNYIECILFSINAASGLDSLYPEAHSLFKKIANIENLLANLFLIVALGRLLSHPLERKAES